MKCTAYDTQIFVFFVGHTRHAIRPGDIVSCVIEIAISTVQCTDTVERERER